MGYIFIVIKCIFLFFVWKLLGFGLGYIYIFRLKMMFSEVGGELGEWEFLFGVEKGICFLKEVWNWMYKIINGYYNF